MVQGNEAAEPTQTNTTTPSQTGDNAGRPGQCAETITTGTAQNLAEINQNMSKMAALLQKICLSATRHCPPYRITITNTVTHIQMLQRCQTLTIAMISA